MSSAGSSADLLLTLMGYLPGLVHAIWIIARR
ncbi:uncharacterized membrane protein YqaE (UPF0057 family) [Salinibacter ruber]|uniref:YqaE/Pmp3 family membrane protein n=2 Tax=Salinibacter ruber TaxID=146919 RepID=Q2RZR7_SALRD|nr:YqaE/Pmp3 family membrane protein [Salinibacter ruber]ABC44437.1 hypothetical protein SRU_2465 [Salinibacter ruber DSM 13855]MBB4062706.1 uncharacterized membrane protein YqaE (UPF0057 family) [Salinibacter ruber]MBB4070659.1 uncharacterized membrane protein YqaE (UPF0057 family) [Salinibacter ruber]MCS3639241.1 uncharacterized membrane protein YqaE (UPF0057 family) [Salinibacter ruber]MCS3662294.1 uncharacterized membrane protein YqaE (UPF0057 family) [Salinibacter ruber]